MNFPTYKHIVPKLNKWLEAIMLQGAEQDSQELEIAAKLVREGQFHLLPKELWFKIYDYFLFDLDARNKQHFKLVCKFFNSLATDKKIIHELIEKYLPIFLGLPKEHIEEPIFIAQMYKILGFKLPPLDQPLEFIPAYILANMLRGRDFDEIVSSLQANLTNIYSQLQGRTLLLKNMKAAFHKNDKKTAIASVISLQGKNTNPSYLNALSFKELLDVYLTFPNVREAIDLFKINNISCENPESFRWAASISDLPLLSQLTEQKIRTLRGFYQPIPQDLLTLKELIDAGNIKEIRTTFGVDFNEAEVESKLNSDPFVKAVSKGACDDIFAQMNAHTIHAFKKLAGRGKLQEKLLKRLIRAGRADLIPLVELDSDFILAVRPMVKRFLTAALNLESPDLQIRDKGARICDAILANSNLRGLLTESPQIAQWACRNNQILLVAEYFSGKNLSRNGLNTLDLNRGDLEHRSLVIQAFNLAIVNKNAQLCVDIMWNTPAVFIPILINVAESLHYPGTFLNALSSIPPGRLENFIRQLFIKASDEKDQQLMNYLLANFAAKESDAAQYALFILNMGSTAKIVRVLRKLSCSAKFEHSNAFGELAVYLVQHSLKKRDFLNQFFALHFKDIPAHHLLKCIELLPSDMSTSLFKLAIDSGKLNYFGRMENKADLIKLTQNPLFIDALRRNPRLIVNMIGDRLNCWTHHYDESDVALMLELFGPYLDTRAKCQLLTVPEPFDLPDQLVRKYPQELTHAVLSEMFGEEHHLTQSVPRPSLLSRVGSLVGSYLPSFTTATTNQKRSLDENNEKDKENEENKKKSKRK